MNKIQKFDRRKQRVRTKIKLISERLRLSIFKSCQHIHAQIIDDKNSATLVAVSSCEKDLKNLKKSNCNKVMAAKLGKILGERAANKNIDKVVFDKGGFKYHGVIEAFANAAREKISF